MNRDIKFRVWDTKYNVIISWDYISESRTLSFFVNNHNRNIFNCVLMQFTGLIDRNGKDIYEGDIVDGGTFKAAIVFQNGCFEIQEPPGKDGVFLRRLTRDHTVSVIGNIYENPNILTVGSAR